MQDPFRGSRLTQVNTHCGPGPRYSGLVAWRAWFGKLEVHLLWVQPPLGYLQTVLPPHGDVIGQWSDKEGRKATGAAAALFRKAGIAHHALVGSVALKAAVASPVPVLLVP